LPLSSNRDGNFDSITVVICLLTAMVELIPSRINYKAQELAELMFENVYKHHGLPKTIVSDRDVLFTSTFWRHLHTLIGTKLKMSSAYHPQTDGATERANRTVTQMLRQCINPNQKDWVSKLPTIQFAINSARSESTGYAPFFLNNGRMPRAMVWNSASPTEYPNVREFAQRKKLALMSAHDSIIGARIKQTRDANRKRRLIPFKEGDFVYLSTKNITFAKGLARKLIPKYIGPYKITKDFNNQSLKLELPMHLKKRGVHDVFHSSLLRMHVPNDDRLFPGRMDTQLGDGPNSEDEWAVEMIRSHAGSGENSVFEILWKSGDITWMPLYQIRHLRALDLYLELLGVADASNLPAGKGKPPQEDPQVFLGAITLCPPFHTPSRHPPSNVSSPSNQYHQEDAPFIHSLDIFHDFYSFDSFISVDTLFPRQDTLTNGLNPPLDFTLSPFDMLKGINHPRFARISKTEYTITGNNSDHDHHSVIHVGQIKNYLTFDKLLREELRVPKSAGIPLGYADFANAFNNGAHPRDRRRLSRYINGQVFPSNAPVFIHDFHITPDQCGLGSAPVEKDPQALVNEAYATSQAVKNQRQQQAYQDRKDKRLSLFTNSRSSRNKPKSHRYNPMGFSNNTVTSESVGENYDYTCNYLAFDDGPAPPSAGRHAGTHSRQVSEAPVASGSSSALAINTSDYTDKGKAPENPDDDHHDADDREVDDVDEMEE
jgi:hypothetical protein